MKCMGVYKMSYLEKIIDISTGAEVTREYTAEQVKEAEKLEKETELRRLETVKREKIRASAIAKLAALGLTEDEITAL